MEPLHDNEAINKIEKKLKFWKRELQDMSGRNRLLFYKETKSSTATIEQPEFKTLFEILVDSGKSISVPLPEQDYEENYFDKSIKENSLFQDLDESADDTPPVTTKNPKLSERNELKTNHTIAEINKVLKNLSYKSRSFQEEQGFNILFMTFGMLKWQDSRNSDFSHAPLILVPVIIDRKNLVSPFKISMAEDEIVLNPVLQTKLLTDFAISLPEIPNDITAEELCVYIDTVSNIINTTEGWEVNNKVTIGVFNFLTQLIIKDFENYLSLYLTNPLIQTLCGIVFHQETITDDLPTSENLDDLVDPITVFQIMDADSSQQEAIEAAKRGLSFILQGPPGTGKSQTIANIIAESIKTGRRILFVSQKMAALEVVQGRLEKCGLGEFCMEVHSHKMDKRKVINNLYKSLSNDMSFTRDTNFKHNQNRIKQLRGELNNYIRQLHKVSFPIEMTLFNVLGQLSELLDKPQLSCDIPMIDQITQGILNKSLLLIRNLASYPYIIETYKNNRWRGLRLTSCTIQERERLSHQFKDSATAIKEFCIIIEDVLSRYNLPKISSIQDAMFYLQIIEAFNINIFSNEFISIANNYIQKYASLFRLFRIQYWKDSSRLKSVSKSNKRLKVQDVLPILKALKILNQQYTFSVIDDIDEIKLPVDQLNGLQNVILEGFQTAQNIFDDDKLPELLILNIKADPQTAIHWFIDHAENTDELSEWSDFNAVKQECLNLNLGDFINKAIDSDVPAEKLADSFLRRFYLLLMEKMIADEPVLQKFRSSSHSEIIKRFISLDQNIIKNTASEIIAEMLSNKSNSSWIQAQTAEPSILRKEYNKKRRFMPLRKLFREIPNLIQSLKPCLLMSPLTTCQLLDPGMYKFDLVIFDEASQIPPEYAICAILRAKQIIVAGDRNQLPPTSFFSAIEIEDYDDEDDDDTPSFESILNACDSASFPNKTLNWHYRSKDESLITFSNVNFYDNRLYTFPNADRANSKSGLQYIYLPNGVYKRGVGARHNLDEARKVAELVINHFKESPELSLGIVALSVSQRKAIEDHVDVLRKEHPEIDEFFSNEKLEPLFIKNLENVQGDERDVIILSIGYGKDETGKITMNFGPINKQGGERRLNVAVTRARYSMILVCSIEAADIDLERTNSTGTRLLKMYLDIAKNGSQAAFKEEQFNYDAEFDSPFEESVYYELTRRGIDLVPQVGVAKYRIDFGVKDQDKPGRFLLGIECDGVMYHSAKTARDRDRLRQQVLENLGWNIYRIWSRDWIENRSKEIDKVLSRIEEIKNNIDIRSPISNSVTGERESLNVTSIQIIEQQSNTNMPDSAIPYKRRKLETRWSTGGEAFLNESISRIVDAFTAIVNAEGPIAKDTAKRRIVEAWETKRGSNIEERLNLAIDYAVRAKKFVIKDNFLWPNNMEKPPLRIHTLNDKPRSIEEIPPEEIRLAIRECVKSALGIMKDDLIREILRLFGYKKLTDNSVIIDEIIENMVLCGELNSLSDKISKGENFD